MIDYIDYYDQYGNPHWLSEKFPNVNYTAYEDEGTGEIIGYSY